MPGYNDDIDKKLQGKTRKEGKRPRIEKVSTKNDGQGPRKTSRGICKKEVTSKKTKQLMRKGEICPCLRKSPPRGVKGLWIGKLGKRGEGENQT